jgi:hypothetical protein
MVMSIVTSRICHGLMLTTSLSWYCVNPAPHMPGAPATLTPVDAAALGIWSANDH